MHFKGLWKVVVALLVVLSVSGCGDGNSNTNGTLSLSVAASPNGSGFALLAATAMVTPVSPGIKVDLVASQYENVAGVITKVGEYSSSVDTDMTGKAQFAINIAQRANINTLQVTVTCGGLHDTKGVSIPKFP